MKTQIHNAVIRFGLILPMVLAALVFAEGCATFASHTNPVADWKLDYSSWPGDSVIEKDCQDYIQKLPPKQRNDVHIKYFYEDGTGRHAVQIEVGVNGIFYGTLWEHVLIYDKDNKRIKVVKYVGGKYAEW